MRLSSSDSCIHKDQVWLRSLQAIRLETERIPKASIMCILSFFSGHLLLATVGDRILDEMDFV